MTRKDKQKTNSRKKFSFKIDNLHIHCNNTVQSCTFDPFRRAPASNLPQAETCPSVDDLISHIGISSGLENSLMGGRSESIASNRKGPLYLLKSRHSCIRTEHRE